MHLDIHLAAIAAQLSAAAALGDERTRQVADTLGAAAGPALRLALLNALSEAADEISAVLQDLPGSPTVAMRLDADDVVVDVRLAETAAATEEPWERNREDGDPSARISLRMSEALKAEVDAAAARDGVSVNAWLVRAATSALNPGPFGAFAAFGQSFASTMAGHAGGGTAKGRQRRDDHRVTGWING